MQRVRQRLSSHLPTYRCAEHGIILTFLLRRIIRFCIEGVTHGYTGKRVHDEVRMSNFGWIGNHYKIISNGAEKMTEKFWDKLRRMAKKAATQISRSNDPNGKKEVYAFPTAYNEIQNGRPCSLNP